MLMENPEQNQTQPSAAQTSEINTANNPEPKIPVSNNTNGWLVPTLVVIILLLLGSTSFFAYQYFQPKTDNPVSITQITNEQTPELTPTPSPEKIDQNNEISDWQTYSNDSYGFSFRYPSDLEETNTFAFEGTETVPAEPITAFVNPSTVVPESDALYDGLRLGYLTLEGQTLADYLTGEVEALDELYQSLWRQPGEYQQTEVTINQTSIPMISSVNSAFKTYYVEKNNDEYLVIQSTESSNDFTRQLQQIIGTIEFTE